MKSHRIQFDETELDFMRDYKDAKGISIQQFVREAVQKKIVDIQAIEDITMLNRLKK